MLIGFFKCLLINNIKFVNLIVLLLQLQFKIVFQDK